LGTAARRVRTYLPARWYEIWNEENCTCFWAPAPDSIEYGNAYIAARDALHATQAGSQAIVGAADPSFFHGIMVSHPGLSTAMDGVAVHPYYDSNANYISTPLAKVVAYRRQMRADSVPDSTPLYITEIGWWGPLSPYGVPDDGPNGTPNRREALVTTTDELLRSNCNVRSYQPYTWMTPENDPAYAWIGIPSSSGEAWFGIVNHDFSLKASAQAWSSEIQLLDGNGPVAPPPGTVTLC
jgi:hypothetical protein